MKIFLPVAGFLVGSAMFIGVNSVFAQPENSQSLVDTLSSRFNLPRDEVQSVFDEHKQERQEQRENRISENLQQKVEEGVITQEQKTLIEERLNSFREQKEELKGQQLNREEMHEKIKALKDELKNWAEQNGIDLSEIMPENGRQGRGGMMHGERHGHEED